MAGIQIDGVNNKIDFDDDQDTSISSATDDTLVIESGGVNIASITSGEFAINEGSADIDFRVESDGATHQLFVDAGNGRVGIGTSSPDYTLHVRSTGSPSNDTFIDIEGNATDANCGIQFTDSGGNLQGRISYDTDDDNLQFNVNASERMRINSSGLISIGATGTIGTTMLNIFDASSAKNGLSIRNSSDTGTIFSVVFQSSSPSTIGSITNNGSSTSYNTSSDYRLKENVETDWVATTRLKQLKPSRFNFKANPDTTVEGFLAHEVSEVLPEAIIGEKDETETKEKVVVNSDGHVIAEGIEEADWTAGKLDGTHPSDSTWEANKTVPVYQSIDQSKLVPLMVKTIQELEARIATLEGN